MVTILVLVSGIVGTVVAITALILGAGPLTALALWVGLGLALTLIGLAAPLRQRPTRQQA